MGSVPAVPPRAPTLLTDLQNRVEPTLWESDHDFVCASHAGTMVALMRQVSLGRHATSNRSRRHAAGAYPDQSISSNSISGWLDKILCKWSCRSATRRDHVRYA